MPTARLPGELHDRLQRLVGERERGVRADHAAHQWTPATGRGGEEPAVLGESGPRDVRPVTVARLVTQDGADAEAVERVGDDVERPVHGRR